MLKGWRYPLCFGLCLVAYTAYVALDTFVLPSAYQKEAVQMNLSQFEVLSAQTTVVSAQDLPQSTSVTTSAEQTIAGIGTQLTDITALTESILETALTQSGAQAQMTATAAVTHTPQSPASGQQQAATATASPPVTAPSVATQVSTTAVPPPVSTQATQAPVVPQLENADYQDANISIKMSQVRENHTNIYVAEVVLSSAQYLKSAFAKDIYGKNITEVTSKIAADHNAILAINGDFYGAQETGYVIRNGTIYRDSSNGADVLCVYADGTMRVAKSDASSAADLQASGVWQAYSFGPGLVSDGSIAVSEREEVATAMASNPRTAIGMISPCHYLFVVSDGRTRESRGLSLYQLAEFMQKMGAKTAYNMDGGGSATMVFNGKIINKPTTNGFSIKERSVSDIVFIG